MKISVAVFLIVSISYVSYAQQSNLFFNYIFDPYLYNPSYIASNGFSEVNLIHRRQWTEIKNAPVISGANIQLVLNPRMAFGVKIINDRTILLNQTSSVLTYGYKIPLGGDQHHLSFGLSFGALFNQLDLDDLENVSDPALYNSELKNVNFEGQFGLHYSFKNFQIGFALPKLLDNDPFIASEVSEIKISEFSNQIITSSYTTYLSTDITFQPYALYRFNTDKTNFYEIGGLFGYKEIVNIGGFYKEKVGPGALIQFLINNQFNISYAHEYVTEQNLSFGGATHEIHFRIRIGKSIKSITKNNPYKTVVLVSSSDPAESESDEENLKEQEVMSKENILETEKEKEEESIINDENEPIINSSTSTLADSNSNEVKLNSKDFYVVAGSFKSEENAMNFYKSVLIRYPESKISFNDMSNNYFIYLYTINKEEASLENLLKIRSITGFKDAWYLKIQ